MSDNIPVHAPLYPSPLVYEVPEFKMLKVVCEADESDVRKLLAPSPFEYVMNRFSVYVMDMQTSTLGPHNDSGIIIPAQFDGVTGGYMAYEFLSLDVAVAAGREPWGYPKKLAEVTLEIEGDAVHGQVKRLGETLIDIQCELTTDTLDIPQTPSDPTLLYQVIPKAEGPGALLRRVISRPVDVLGDGASATRYGRAEVTFGTSREDPLHEIRPRSVLGATYSTGTYHSAWGQVLATLENNT